MHPITARHNLFYGHEINGQKFLFIFDSLFLNIYEEDKLYLLNRQND